MATSVKHYSSKAKLRTLRAKSNAFESLRYHTCPLFSPITVQPLPMDAVGAFQASSWGPFTPSFRDGIKMFDDPFQALRFQTKL